MESGRSYDLPGSSEPPPYTISDGLHPVPINPSCPPSKSPLPNRRPYEAFGDNPSNTYGSYPPCQMSQGQVAYGQMPYGNGQTFHGQMPHGQMPPVHTGGSYGYGYPQGQTYPTPQFCAPGQAPYYPSYALPPQRPPQQQQQQQQSVVIIGGTTPRYNQPVTFVQSFSGHISLACFVFWCCGGLFGLVAFVLAVVASNQAHHDPVSARQMGRISIWVSVTGIITTVIIACVVFGIVFSRLRKTNYYYYY